MRDTLMFLKQNTNIPHAHAGYQGTTVNQDSRATLRAPRISTVIRPTPPMLSILRTAAHLSIEKRVVLQTDTTPVPTARSREAQSHSSTSTSENSDRKARERLDILAGATGSYTPLKARKGLGPVPSPTLSFPSAAVRIWRIGRSPVQARYSED